MATSLIQKEVQNPSTWKTVMKLMQCCRAMVTALLKRCKVTQHLTAPYSHQSNGQVENCNRRVMDILRAMILDDRLGPNTRIKADHIRIAELCIRFDSLAAVMQSVDSQKTIWKCPVCCQDLCSMRSFKAHCKRLFEFYHPSDAKTAREAGLPVPHAQHKFSIVASW